MYFDGHTAAWGTCVHVSVACRVGSAYFQRACVSCGREVKQASCHFMNEGRMWSAAPGRERVGGWHSVTDVPWCVAGAKRPISFQLEPGGNTR